MFYFKLNECAMGGKDILKYFTGGVCLIQVDFCILIGSNGASEEFCVKNIFKKACYIKILMLGQSVCLPKCHHVNGVACVGNFCLSTPFATAEWSWEDADLQPAVQGSISTQRSLTLRPRKAKGGFLCFCSVRSNHLILCTLKFEKEIRFFWKCWCTSAENRAAELASGGLTPT